MFIRSGSQKRTTQSHFRSSSESATRSPLLSLMVRHPGILESTVLTTYFDNTPAEVQRVASDEATSTFDNNADGPAKFRPWGTELLPFVLVVILLAAAVSLTMQQTTPTTPSQVGTITNVDSASTSGVATDGEVPTAAVQDDAAN